MSGGVLHLGAHHAQELDLYIQLGAKFVVWVEPDPKQKARLSALSTPYSRYLDVAVSDAAGFAELNLYNLSCCSSIMAKGPCDIKGILAPIVPLGMSVSVPTATLDTVAPQGVELLTMDIQGAELKALAGGSRFLSDPVLKFIYTELYLNEVYIGQPTRQSYERALRPYGFELVAEDAEGEDWFNLLYRRR